MDVPGASRTGPARAARDWTLLAAAALMAVILATAALVASSNLLKVSAIATPPPSAVPVPPTPSPTPTPTPVLTPAASADATSSAPPILIPGNLIAVFHLSGSTAEILTVDPATGQQQQVGTVPVALQLLGKNVFAATLGPGWADVEWSTDRRLITLSTAGDPSNPTAQFDVLTGNKLTIALREGYVSPDGNQPRSSPLSRRRCAWSISPALSRPRFHCRPKPATSRRSTGHRRFGCGSRGVRPAGHFRPNQQINQNGQVFANTTGGPGWGVPGSAERR